MSPLLSRRLVGRLWLSALALSGFLLASLCLYSAWLWSGQPDPNEQYVVWSSYLNQAHHGDSHDLPGGLILTAIQDRTLSLGSDINPVKRFFLIFFSALHDARTTTGSKSTFHSFLLMNFRARSLERRFSLEGSYSLVSEAVTQSPKFQEKFPNAYGYIVLSSVGFNRENSEAHFYIEHICGLCGSGRYVLMRKSDQGGWKLIEEQYSWVS